MSDQADPLAGIRCPSCACAHSEITHTERLPRGQIRRRRICRNCAHKFTTLEVPPAQVKDDAQR